jgi:nitrate reductase gamma subunit
MENLSMEINWLILGIVFIVFLLPMSVMAYLGPGATVSSIGALLAVIAGIIVAIFGFLFYPIRRLIHKRKKKISRMESDSKE